VESRAGLAALVESYQASTDSLRSSLGSLIESLWAALTSWQQSDVDAFAKDAAAAVAGSQQQMVNLTAGFLSEYRSLSLGTAARQVKVNPRRYSALRGVDPLEVYARPGETVRWKQSKGKTLEEAVELAGKRAVNLATTDLQLAKREVSHDILGADSKAIAWRRQLEGSYSCGLCIVASTNTYHKINKLQIHPGCDCSVQPIYDEDTLTDHEIAADKLLSQSHAEIRDTFGDASADARSAGDYRDLIIVHNHGELGPVLGVRGQHWVSPGQLPNLTHHHESIVDAQARQNPSAA
jgi:hypothetical protein